MIESSPKVDSGPPVVRVLFVSSSFARDGGEHHGIFVRRLTDALAHRASVHVLMPSPGDCVRPDTGYTVEQLRVLPARAARSLHGAGGIPAALQRNPLLVLALLVELLGLFAAILRRARSHDVIHANWSVIGVICAAAGRLRGIPVVTSLRGSDLDRLADSAAMRWLTRTAISMSHRTITVSSEMREQLAATFPMFRNRLAHVSNGVDARLLAVPPPRSPARIRALVLGSLIPRKRVDDALAAIARLDTCAAVSLSVAGDGPLREALENRARALGIEDRCRFVGAVEPAELPCLLQGHEVLVLPSRLEGRPNVVLEAMAAARPIIATDISGVRELLTGHDCGLLFPVGDVDALAEHLRALATAPSRLTRMGTAARKRIQELNLTWSRAAEELVSVYIRATSRQRQCAA